MDFDSLSDKHEITKSITTSIPWKVTCKISVKGGNVSGQYSDTRLTFDGTFNGGVFHNFSCPCPLRDQACYSDKSPDVGTIIIPWQTGNGGTYILGVENPGPATWEYWNLYPPPEYLPDSFMHGDCDADMNIEIELDYTYEYSTWHLGQDPPKWWRPE